LSGKDTGLSESTGVVLQVQPKLGVGSDVNVPGETGASLLREAEESSGAGLIARENAQKVGGSSSAPGDQERLADDGGQGGIDHELSHGIGCKQQNSGNGGESRLHG